MFTKLLSIITTRSFKPFTFYKDFTNHLEYQELESLGLYVHIPFCKTLCTFCPYSKQTYDKNLANMYKRALLNEIELVTKYDQKKKSVTSLYFGGGTPSLMIDDLKDIIDKLNEKFAICGGIGVELHPDDINHDILSKLKDAKVTMLSLGIQSFNPNVLKNIGRMESGFIEKLQLAKSFHFDVIDIDLIFGIPGQTIEILEEDIRIAFTYGATQVSTYPFIDFTYSDNKNKPLSKKVKRKMLKHLEKVSEELGLDRTSVWTFAKKNTEKYSSVTRDNFLGFGTSATTLLQNTFKINTFSIEDYIRKTEESQLPTALTLNFTLRQRAVYFLFWSAYGMDIDTQNYKNIIGRDLNKMYRFEMFFARLMGYIRKTDKGYQLTSKGALVYHEIEQKYTLAYIDKMWNISRLTPFPEKITLL